MQEQNYGNDATIITDKPLSFNIQPNCFLTGCGKTLLTESLCGHLKYSILRLHGANIKDKWIGRFYDLNSLTYSIILFGSRQRPETLTYLI
jgi:hypothetical protein